PGGEAHEQHGGGADGRRAGRSPRRRAGVGRCGSSRVVRNPDQGLGGQLRVAQSRDESLLPDSHPTQGAFPTSYIIKDLSYALAVGECGGVTLEQASTTRRLMERTAAAGYRDNYYTAVLRTIAKG